MAVIQLVQFTAGLLFSIYIMLSGLLAFFNGAEISVVQGKLIIGLLTAGTTALIAKRYLEQELPAVTGIVYPLIFGFICLGLNDVFGGPFDNWPLISQLVRI